MVDRQAEADDSAHELVNSHADGIHFEETIATNETMEDFLRASDGQSSHMTAETEARFGFSVDPNAPDATRYEVHQKIGEGAHGVVFRAHDRLLHRTLAIKQFNEMTRATYPTLASAETRIAAAVDHPGTPTIYDV